ncbi:MAG: type I 3-dehydroquinate dehydratase [Bacteroidia bacterium]
MPYKICTVVQGTTLPVFLRNLAEANSVSKMVELRADSIKDFEEEDIDTLKKNARGTSIFTFRHVKEGGLFAGESKEQKDILVGAFSSGFDYVDVSYGNSVTDNLSAKERKQLVLSYHDFKATSSLKKLTGIIDKMRKESPAIIKVATMVNDSKDIFTLVDLLKEREDKEKFIIIGMGEMGKMTRLMFPVLGSYLTYASKEGTKAAPGIMTGKEMQSVYKIIIK